MRFRNLDALRGVAILLVLSEHRYASDLWTRIGWTGVDLFFVLSGFLISGLLFREYEATGSINVSRFLLRRGFKIYPGYYVALAYYVIRDHEFSDQTLRSLIFVQNYGATVNHTWSLAVEEHFYLILSIGVAWLARRALVHALEWIIPWSLVVVLVLRVVTGVCLPYSNITHHFATHLRIDSLLFGVFIGYAHYYADLGTFVRERRWRIVVASISMLSIAYILPREELGMAGLSGVYLAYGGVLALALYVVPDVSSTRVGALLSRLGRYSYAIYLWHPPVASGGIKLLERATGPLHYLVAFGVYLAVSIGIGVLMTHAIEIPMLRLRDRYVAGVGLSNA